MALPMNHFRRAASMNIHFLPLTKLWFIDGQHRVAWVRCALPRHVITEVFKTKVYVTGWIQHCGYLKITHVLIVVF